MSPYILGILAIPCLLGIVVILRMLYVGGKAAKAKISRRSHRGTDAKPVALLDQPFACPTCNLVDCIRVARSNFKEMPYVEHFICEACGTAYLGPNQEAMVQKRLEAQRKVQDILTGRKKKPG